MSGESGQVAACKHVAVIGCGAFGTAMATVAARNGHTVLMYGRDPEQVKHMNEKRHNPRYVSEHTLEPNISATADVDTACANADVIFLAIPAQRTPAWLEKHRDSIPSSAILCNTAKGLFLETGELLEGPILRAVGRPDQPLCFLSGPSFATELMDRQPTMVVVASRLLYHAVTVQRLLSNLYFRAYTSQDVVGVQLGGALKNPLAIGAGIIEGKGFGINSQAAYITRSSMELQHLCVAMGGEASTISGLSGIGDLMLTAFGGLSRNRKCGKRLAAGETLEAICADYTVEGVPTAQVAVAFADKCGLDLPIFRLIQKVLHGELSTEEAMSLMMERPLKQEHLV